MWNPKSLIIAHYYLLINVILPFLRRKFYLLTTFQHGIHLNLKRFKTNFHIDVKVKK